MNLQLKEHLARSLQKTKYLMKKCQYLLCLQDPNDPNTWHVVQVTIPGGVGSGPGGNGQQPIPILPTGKKTVCIC